MEQKETVEVVLVDPRLEGMLEYSTPQAAGLDLRVCSLGMYGCPLAKADEGWVFSLQPSDRCVVGTGIKVHIGSFFDSEDFWAAPDSSLGIAGIVIPRSGVGTKRRIALSNTVGLIDSDYQGEILLTLENNGDTPWDITGMERIAQLVIMPVFRPQFRVVEAFSVGTVRGSGGFGSTGAQ